MEQFDLATMSDEAIGIEALKSGITSQQFREKHTPVAGEESGQKKESTPDKIKFEPKTETEEKPKAPDTGGEKTEKTETPAYDFSKYHSKFKSQQDIDDFFSNTETIHTEYSKTKQQLDAIKQHNMELLREVEKRKYNIDDEETYKLYQLRKATGIKDYGLLSKIITTDADSLGELEAIKLARLVEDPDADINILDRSLSRKYTPRLPKEYADKEDFDANASEREKEDYALDEQELNDQRRIDSRNAKRTIKEKSASIKMPEIETPEQQQAKNKELLEKWQKPWKELTEGLNKLTVEVPTGKNKEKYTMDIDIPEEAAAIIANGLAEYIVKNRIASDEEGISNIRKMATDAVWHIPEARNHIVGDIAAKARLVEAREWDKQVHNSSQRDQGKQPPEQQSMTDEQKAIAKMQAEQKAGAKRNRHF
jgi:hypothetical protein